MEALAVHVALFQQHLSIAQSLLARWKGGESLESLKRDLALYRQSLLKLRPSRQQSEWRAADREELRVALETTGSTLGDLCRGVGIDITGC